MPKVVGTRAQWDELESLNSNVHFASVSGEGPVYVSAMLVDRTTNRPWVRGRGETREFALDDVLEKAKTAPRPATTAVQLQADLDQKTQQLADATAEVERLKRQLQARSQRVRPDGSQAKAVSAS